MRAFGIGRLDGQQIRSPFVARTKTRAARLLKRLLCTNVLDMKNNMMIAQNRKGVCFANPKIAFSALGPRGPKPRAAWVSPHDIVISRWKTTNVDFLASAQRSSPNLWNNVRIAC